MSHPCVGTHFLNFSGIYLPQHNDSLHNFYFMIQLASVFSVVLTGALSISAAFYYEHLVIDNTYSYGCQAWTQDIRWYFPFNAQHKK